MARCIYNDKVAERTQAFPDYVMIFIYHLTKVRMQRRHNELAYTTMTHEGKDQYEEDPLKVFRNYRGSSSERVKYLDNEMLMNGRKDSDWHIPLMVNINKIKKDRPSRQTSGTTRGTPLSIHGDQEWTVQSATTRRTGTTGNKLPEAFPSEK